MTTTINFNGSKFAGDGPDSIEVFKERLRTEPLDPMFEEYGCFAYAKEGHEGYIRFWGNFYNLSAAFSIDTNDDDLIVELVKLIKANMESEAYLEAKAERAEQANATLARSYFARKRGREIVS